MAQHGEEVDGGGDLHEALVREEVLDPDVGLGVSEELLVGGHAAQLLHLAPEVELLPVDEDVLLQRIDQGLSKCFC